MVKRWTRLLPFVVAVVLAATTIALPADAAWSHRAKRSAAAKREFRHAHPCPATGKASGPCPGYVIDHVKPLCAGGADAPSNMQWQTKADSKAKDKLELEECRALRKGRR